MGPAVTVVFGVVSGAPSQPGDACPQTAPFDDRMVDILVS
jgi:hypothetical protein